VTTKLDCYEHGMNPGHSDSRESHRHTRLHLRLSSVLMILLSAIYCSIAVAQPVQELHTVRQLKALSAEQAGLNMPVRLRGTVTVLSGWKSAFFLEDATGGISIEPGENSPSLRAGDIVEVRGVTGPGKFAPVISANRVSLVGRGKLPSARSVTADDFAGGRLDSEWVGLKGLVRSAAVRPEWGSDTVSLGVDVGGGTLVTLRTRDFADCDWRRLPGSLIYAQGVLGTIFNDKRQFIGSRLFVSRLSDVKILQSGPADPFAYPLRPLGSLLRYDPKQTGIRPVRVRGIVTSPTRDQGFYIQQGADGILVHTEHSAHVVVGDELEVVGYPSSGDYSPTLDNAIFRIINQNPRPVRPVAVRASSMIVQKDGFPTSPYDSMLVRVSGELQHVLPGPEEVILFLTDGKDVFAARVPTPRDQRRLPAVGSLLELTGVCVTRVDAAHGVQSFRLLLSSVSDITVIQKAPWWNAKHALDVIAVLCVAILMLLGWLALAHRESRLRRDSVTDPLTGLYNRRGFALLAEHQWQLAQRKKSSFLLLYIDVDGFKEINDSFGHKQGDTALQAVSEILRACFRKTDLIGRLGGDEFAVAALEVDPQSQEQIEDRLAALIEATNRRWGNTFALSLSVGVLVCDQSMVGTNIENLLERADALMYHEKADNRALRTLVPCTDH
jgi:diguanylate cyclase (GGDEF)-like protein